MTRALSAQRGLWFAHSITRTSSVYTVGELIDFDSAPDVERLCAATRGAIGEADGLTARFSEADDGEVILEWGAPLTVDSHHLGTDPALIDHYATNVVGTEIDPTTGPCAKVSVLTAGDRVSLLLIAHHIVLDAYGIGLIVRRIGHLYADPTDPRVLRQMRSLPADFDAPREDDAEFWAQELRGITGPLTLASRPRTHRVAERIYTARTVVPHAGHLTRSPAMLATIVAAFCGRRTDVDDVVLGFPMMNRLGSLAANVACTTVNVLPLRINTAAHRRLGAIADSVTDSIRALSAHSRYRSEDIVRDLRRRGVDGAVGPTVNIKPFGSTVQIGDHIGTVRSLARGPVVDLSITALELDTAPGRGDGTVGAGDLELLIDADADLYSAHQVSEILHALGAFVDASTSASGEHARVGSVRWAASADADRADAIRASDMQTVAPIDPMPLVRRILTRPADSLALICGDERLDGGGLRERVSELSGRLGQMAGEDIVAVALPRSIDLVVALLAVLDAGAAFLPLDPGFPAARLESTLADARPVAIIEPGPAGIHIRRLDSAVERQENTVRDQSNSRGHQANSGKFGRSAPGEHDQSPAYVIYTSGSTGIPKGVVISHRALRNFADSMIAEIGYGPGETILAVTTIAFDIALLETLVPLAAGATVVLASTADVHDPARLADLIARHEVRYMQATPSLWSAFLDARRESGLDVLARVNVLVGGEALPADLAAQLCATAASVRNMYGPTETTIWSTTALLKSPAPGTSSGFAGGEISIGTAIANTGVRVLDSALRPVEVGRVGELYLCGDGLARGYRGQGALTATRFVADPWGPSGSRMYRTGDLARIADDATLTCLGRTDHQVKIRGFRIELGDIEQALAQHDSVERAVVVAHDTRLVAYVTAADGGVIDPLALRSHLALRVPDYMLPALIVEVAEIPLTPNGKVDRRALPAPDFGALAGRSRAPETRDEQVLADIFATVLGVARVGADDDFFLLGGDSITAVRVVARAAEAGLVFAPIDIFDGPTVSALAAVSVRTAVSVPTAVSTPAKSAVSTPGRDAAIAPSPSWTTAGVGADEFDELTDGNLL